MITLIVTPDPKRPGSFLGFVDDELIIESRQPLADAARVLIDRGVGPETLITMRHGLSAHDSFEPAPLKAWAAITYEETASGPVIRRWKPFPAGRFPPKRGSDDKSGT
jgi:hypothetical protein